ncbi:hypothetical protein EGM51_08410 [Verrucomicrobia bacterium S94]|nr:hypothetical protein EGM51_08410 [Verrucomicrobia bacterium S94]
MEIGFTTGSSSPVYSNVNLNKTDRSASGSTESDQVHTSDRALLLSRSLAALKKQMEPREKILQQYAAELDTPVKPDDSSLDRILSQL